MLVHCAFCQVNDDIEAAFDLSVKKKKKKPKKKKEKKEKSGEGASSSNQDEADDLECAERDRRARELSPHIFDYELLLTRVLEMCGNRGKEKVRRLAIVLFAVAGVYLACGGGRATPTSTSGGVKFIV